jgi:hypothetical protein
VLVCREAAATAPPIALRPGVTVRWDGRFSIQIDAAGPTDLALGALGPDLPADAARVVPAAALTSLPALRDLAGVAAIPHLQYERPDRAGLGRVIAVTFRPERALAGTGFTVV